MFRQHIREIDDNARLLCTDQLGIEFLISQYTISIKNNCPQQCECWSCMCNNMSNKNSGEYSVRCNIKKLSTMK